jgi:hypothetical protein
LESPTTAMVLARCNKSAMGSGLGDEDIPSIVATAITGSQFGAASV